MEKKNSVPADIEPVTNSRRNGISVHQYGLDGKYIATFDSMRKASDATKATYSSIAECIKGKLKTAGGYQWRAAK
ncbi:MAG: hypothetical protein JXR56_02075 [Candidatus Cloacimonetes bacterium]|nr:hypothetical protein [Candidatus Cloacimonadota bacterium]